MEGYVPGEQPPPGERVIKLNTNENPYPPSPAALKVLREMDGETLRRYPDPMACAPRAALAAVIGGGSERSLAGNGSDELLTMIFRACADDKRTVAYAAPSYVLYRTLGQIQGAETIEVPFDDEYALPGKALGEAGAAVTIVASPNSP